MFVCLFYFCFLFSFYSLERPLSQFIYYFTELMIFFVPYPHKFFLAFLDVSMLPLEPVYLLLGQTDPAWQITAQELQFAACYWACVKDMVTVKAFYIAMCKSHLWSMSGRFRLKSWHSKSISEIVQMNHNSLEVLRLYLEQGYWASVLDGHCLAEFSLNAN